MSVEGRVTELAMAGMNLSVDEANGLEGGLLENPQDIQARTQLLGYYFLNSIQEEAAVDAKNRHVLWLIEHVPEGPILGTPFGLLHQSVSGSAYDEGVGLWQTHLDQSPYNIDILKNVIQYFLLYDRSRALVLAERVVGLVPDDADMYRTLGELYRLDLLVEKDPVKILELSGVALEYFKSAYEHAGAELRDSLRRDLLRMAFSAERFDQAKSYAEDMLKNNPDGWNHGNNIFYAHLILGQLALRNDEIDNAKVHLLQAGKCPGSPQLNSFGPSMILAQALLEKGESQAVLEFFKLCSAFWSDADGNLINWAAAVEAGRGPDFGSRMN